MFKKLVKLVACLAAVVLLLAYCVGSAELQNEADQQAAGAQDGSLDEYRRDDGFRDDWIDDRFEWVEHPHPVVVPSNPWPRIEGIVRNISGEDYGFVQIRFSVFDSQGHQVGSVSTSINNLGNGSTWRFSAMSTLVTEIGHFEFSEITAN
ncbi:MAG: FxLYD domain-containing protein [Defluviitaleaceae bacterium]|nr:FxLYD domain-containing protein [Defluviitaleaceae bacterium]